MSATKVTESHWAESDRKKMAELQAALPAVLVTTHADWQARVDNGPTTYSPHAHLHVVRALRYGYAADGIWSPTGEERTYLVTTPTGAYRAAYEAVQRYLAAEFPGVPSQEWAFASPASTQLVLDGGAR